MKFCIGVGVSDVITHANLGEFSTFPLTCVVVLKTLWHYRVIRLLAKTLV